MRQGYGWSGNERNCCFLNVGPSRFANVGAVTKLDLPDDGRALAVTDWDGDGKLDLWTNSRTSPRLRMLRNNLQGDAHFLAIKLRGVRCNRDAIGTRLELHYGTDGTKKLIRSLRAGEGFLAQSTQWIHFGLGSETAIDRLVIRWPGGDTQTLTQLVADHRYVIEQGHGVVPPGNVATRRVHLPAATVEPPRLDQQARIVLAAPLPMPEMVYQDLGGARTTLAEPSEGAMLINLWASWCHPCILELEEFSQHAPDLRNAGVKILALNVDELDKRSQHPAPTNLLRDAQRKFPFEHAVATDELVRTLDVVLGGLLDQQRPLTLPTSFLVDAQNRLRVIYKGPVTPEQLVSDSRPIGADPQTLRDAAVPFRGRWHNAPSVPDPIMIAMRFIEAGDPREASRYLEKYRTISSPADAAGRREGIATQFFLARLLAENGHIDAAIAAFEEVLRLDPGHVPAMVGLSHALLQQNRVDQADKYLVQALKLDAGHAEAMAYLGEARLQQGRTADALQWYRKALRIRPGWIEVANNLAWMLATGDDPQWRNADEALRLARQACEATGYKNARMLDTLAAAYAEGGQYAEAVKTAQHAVDLAASSGQTDLATELRSRLKQYQSQQPFRTRPMR
jgi:cytochrome c-type biogenesis protein CcmH/NrfG/thiol-disulfide isomerase/thioredoxin